MEDYLKEIYRLYRAESSGIVHVSDIASSMKFTKASVCRATDLLAEKGFLQKDKYKGLFLTKEGVDYAEYIVKRHRVITTFLTDILRLDIDTACQDACGIEHVISPECYKSMSGYLNDNAVNI